MFKYSNNFILKLIPKLIQLISLFFVYFFFKKYDITFNNIEDKGSFVVIYNLINLLYIYIFLEYLFKIGYGFQKIINPKLKISSQNIGLISLLSLIAGLILTNIIFSILILTNIQNKIISIIFVIVLFVIVKENLFSKKFLTIILYQNKKSLFYLGFCILLIFFFVINPYKFFVGSGDSTSHYIPFFTSIKNIGGYINTATEIPWYHIFQNKGDGFHFFTSFISDPLLIKNNNLIIFCISILLIRFILKKYSFTEFSFFILFLFLIGNFNFNLYTTHLTHFLFFCYLGFYFFLVIENKTSLIEKRLLNNFNFINLLTFFFIGYYQPIYLSFYLTIIIFLILIVKLVKIPIKRFCLMFLTMIIGATTSLLINFYFTGLFDMVPFKLNIELGNSDKFFSLFGIGNYIFFIDEQKNLLNFNITFFTQQPFVVILVNLLSFIKIFFSNFKIFFLILPLYIIYYLFHKIKKKEINLQNINKTQLILLKIDRLSIKINYLFIYCIVCCLVFFIFFIISMNNSSYERFSANMFLFSGLIFIYFTQIFIKKINKNYCKYILAIFFIYSLNILHQNISFKDIIITTKIFNGSYSIKNSLERYEKNKDELNFIIKSKKIIGEKENIYTFNHFPESLIFYPRTILMHEPSYSLGYCFSALIDENPKNFIFFFKEKNINYIIYDKKKDFISFIKFSQYLNENNLYNFFDIIYKEKNLELLKFKKEYLVNLNDTKSHKNVIKRSFDYNFKKKCNYN